MLPDCFALAIILPCRRDCSQKRTETAAKHAPAAVRVWFTQVPVVRHGTARAGACWGLACVFLRRRSLRRGKFEGMGGNANERPTDGRAKGVSAIYTIEKILGVQPLARLVQQLTRLTTWQQSSALELCCSLLQRQHTVLQWCPLSSSSWRHAVKLGRRRYNGSPPRPIGAPQCDGDGEVAGRQQRWPPRRSATSDGHTLSETAAPRAAYAPF